MLNERKLTILKLIIDDFINTGLPIGSRAIAKKPQLGISSATIRNEMADLEDLGYLFQPHSSSGRIPSEMGYRFYVDSLILEDGEINIHQKELIRELILNKKIKVEDVVKKAAKILSEVTGYAAMVSLPRFSKSRLSNMKLVKVTESKVMMILVSNTGIVKTLMLPLTGTNQRVLDNLSDSLINNLTGATIEDLNVKNVSRLKYTNSEFGEIIDYLLPIMKESFKDIDDLDIVTCGLNNMLSIPEFSDIQRVKELIASLEEKEIQKQILNENDDEGIKVKIGQEIGIEALKECSVVTATYKYKGTEIGQIGIVGHTRMDYGSILSVVEYIRNTLSDIFSGIYL